jgi:hypothetical protein
MNYGDLHVNQQQMYLPTRAQKEYLPIRHFMPPKQYQPVNPNSYLDPEYDSKLPEYVKLPDQTLVPPAANLHSSANSDFKSPDYKPTKDGYLPPPPSSSYLPPSEAYKPPADGLFPPLPGTIEGHW